jgi:transposase
VDDRLNRHDLTDEEWQRLLPMMPADARRDDGGVITRW